MDNYFKKINIASIVFIYIISLIFTYLFTSNIDLNGSCLSDVLLNIFILIGLITISFKVEHISINTLKKHIKFIDLKKIIKPYILITFFSITSFFLITYFIKAYTINSSLNKDMIFTIINTLVMIPIIEEFVFRGVILNRLRIKHNEFISIIISSTIFAIIYFDINFLGRFIFGLLVALLYIETKNIFNCIIFHALNNITVSIFIDILYGNNIFNITMLKDNNFFIYIIIIFNIISLILNFIYIRNRLKFNKSLNNA